MPILCNNALNNYPRLRRPPLLIPFHFKIDAFRQAGEAGEAGEAGGERKIICMADFVKWYKGGL
ncbi:hypothetical protein NIES4103_24940 [Nostoc sp. NIES-4103]|nr:hypothetical protein NIES4103_24940 [Nostoc sp. NIES-4103]